MSGHSKWATIKRKKAVVDAKRGKLFTQLIKEIAIAARAGGDAGGNPRLRLAVEKAKANNMPADNIKRAIQRGTGELPGVTYEEMMYEGYGPGGAALLIESVTDNKNRTVSELRHLLERYGGKLGASNSVAWMFHKKGVIQVSKTGPSEDDLVGIILDAGAEDMKAEDDVYTITTTPDLIDRVKQALESKGVKVENTELQMIPENTVRVEGKDAENLLKLMEMLEEHDDVPHVYSNFDIDDKILATFQANAE